MLNLGKRVDLAAGILLVLALNGCSSGSSDSDDPLDPTSGTGQEASIDAAGEPDAVDVDPVDRPCRRGSDRRYCR